MISRFRPVYNISFQNLNNQSIQILNNEENLEHLQEAQNIIVLNKLVKKEGLDLDILFQDNVQNNKIINNEGEEIIKKNQNPLVFNYPEILQIKSPLEIEKFIEENKENLSQQQKLIHAICHIEYNAMKTYLDTTIRFPIQLRQLQIQQNEKYQNYIQQNKEEQYTIIKTFIQQGLQVAAEEAKHFTLLTQRLQKFSVMYQQKERQLDYGFIPVVDSIRRNTIDTTEYLHERVGLTSMIQEGKGIDAGDRLLQNLMKFEDKESQKILKLILREEVGHIQFGRVWFEYYCQLKGLNVQDEFNRIKDVNNYKFTKQFNAQARVKAGFGEEWFEKVFNIQMPKQKKTKQNQNLLQND